MTDRSVGKTPASIPEVEAFAGEGLFTQGLIESGLHGVKMDESWCRYRLRAESARECERASKKDGEREREIEWDKVRDSKNFNIFRTVGLCTLLAAASWLYSGVLWHTCIIVHECPLPQQYLRYIIPAEEGYS